jgi:sec-independent protein translocase protein TatB
MFDIAWSELLLIAVVALIFIGPKELPQVLNNLGRAAGKMRRSADEFRRHFEDSMREAGYEDLHKNIQDLKSLNPGNQIRESLDRAINRDYAAKPAPAAAQPAKVETSGQGQPAATPEITAFEAAAVQAAPGAAQPADGASADAAFWDAAELKPAGPVNGLAKDHTPPAA